MLRFFLGEWLRRKPRKRRRLFCNRRTRRRDVASSHGFVEFLEDRTLLAAGPLELQPIGDQSMSHNDDTLVITLSTNSETPEALTYTAEAFTYDPLSVLAFDLDQQYGLFDYTAGHYWYDYFGLQEKWMEGFGREYYYIIPDGGFYFYNGSIATSPLLATLDTTYHADPALLHDALPPEPIVAEANVSIAGDELTIDPPAGFLGEFMVTVTVGDGVESDSETFTVHVANTPPTIDPIADQTMPPDGGPLQIVLSAEDADGDPVTLALSEPDPLSILAYDLDQQYGLFDYTGGHYWYDYFGLQEKWMEGFGREYYYITPDGGLYFYNGSIATSPLIGTLDPSYHADPTKLHDAPDPAIAEGSVDVSLAGNVLTVAPVEGYYGNVLITIEASDGYETTTESFSLSVLRTIQGSVPITLQQLDPLAIDTDTGDKPQSKVWRHADKWWMVLSDDLGTYVWRLDGTSWNRVLQVSQRTSFKADVKLLGDVAHLLLEDDGSTELRSLEYVAGSPGTYQFWSAQPNAVSIPGLSSIETATVDIDSASRMWVAYDRDGLIQVRYSDAPYTTWSGPITLASGAHDDDIAAVKALPNGSIGVMWSNQNTERFGFRVHVDGTDPNVWLADELPAAQSALDVNDGFADDHLSLAVHSDGTLYAAVKTSYDTIGLPLVALLIRRPDGSWDDLYFIDDLGSRPIVQLNEETGAVYVFYRNTSSDGPIVFREVIDTGASVTIGDEQTLFEADGIVDLSDLNDVSGSKANVSDEMVVIAASDDHLASVQLHFLLSGGPTSLDDSYTVAEAGTFVAGDANGTIGGVSNDGVLVNDFDDDGLPLTATLVSGPLFGSLTLNADGTFTYTHDGSENYLDQFRYRANNGTENGNIATVSITVTPVNDPPTAFDDGYSVAEGSTLIADDATGQSGTAGDNGVLANDTDSEGDTLSATLITAPSHGSLTLNSDGTFQYTHDGSVNSSDQFTYRINDGTADGNVATASITILPVDDPPVAADDFYTVAEGGTLLADDPGGQTGAADDDGLLGNDADPEGSPLSAVLVQGPVHGLLQLAGDGTFSYVHNDSETLSDTFTYRANDGVQNGNLATAHITITPVNDLPAAIDDQYTVTTGETLTADDPSGSAGGANDNGVLANDTDTDNPSLTAVLVAGTANGLLTLNADGTFSYTHDGSDTSTDSFTYRAFDGTEFGNVATVTINIGDVNLEPVTLSFQEGAAGYSGAGDASIYAAAPNTNTGSSATLETDGSPDKATLLKWSLADVQPGSTIVSASITLNVTNRSDDFYEIYAALQPWIEQEVTWLQAANGLGWQAGGASGVGDHGATAVGVLTAPDTGLTVVELNDEGIAVVQSWIDDPNSNFGVIIQDYSNSTSNGLDATSREGEIVSERPMLTITVVPPGGAPVNRSPVVDAGPDQSIFITETVLLDGSVSDDSLPDPLAAVTTTWSVISGPGSVTFADATQADTTAEFSQPGTYVLRLTADDGALIATDDVTITVVDTTETLTVDLQDGVNGYAGTSDATIMAASPAVNVGSAAELEADGSPDKATLLRWETSSVAAGSTVVSASMTLDVTNRSDDFYELYGLSTSWSESEVTWTQSATGANWQIAGAGGAADRGSTVVGVLTAPSTGVVTIDLNAAGVALVQSWIDDPSTNFGLIIQDYDDGTSNGLDVSSSESAAASQRPKLSITYTSAAASQSQQLLATSNSAESSQSGEDSTASAAASELTSGALAAVAEEAARRWIDAAHPDARDETARRLGAVSYEIIDLAGDRLGEASGSLVRIDVDAAGYGWFIDSTPFDSLEFSNADGVADLQAPAGSAAAGQMDLLSVLMHELGHVLGRTHADDHDVMDATLSPGTRRLIDAEPQAKSADAEIDEQAVDVLFSDIGTSSQLLLENA